MTKIFFPLKYYEPGYKAGGILRAVANLIQNLGDRYAFYVCTTDRDFGDAQPYEGIRLDAWIRHGKAHVYYHGEGRGELRNLFRQLRTVKPDIIMLSGIFSSYSIAVLLWRRLGLLPFARTVVTPHGMLSPGAMSVRRPKKKLYIAIGKMLGLFRGLIWNPCDVDERQDVQNEMGPQTQCQITPILAFGQSASDALARSSGKLPGMARFVFVSRISEEKNLDFLFDRLLRVQGNFSLDIFGPSESTAYFSGLRQRVKREFPQGNVRFKGVLGREHMISTLARYDFFVLPTRGENFGFVLAEALQAGLPLVVSDCTPWRGLPSAGAGWDLSLLDIADWDETLKHCIEMSATEHQSMRQAAAMLLQAKMQSQDTDAYGELFSGAIEREF